MKEFRFDVFFFFFFIGIIGITAFLSWSNRDGYMRVKVTRKLPVARQIEVTDGKNTYYFDHFDLEQIQVSGTYCFEVRMINPSAFSKLVDDYFCDKNDAS